MAGSMHPGQLLKPRYVADRLRLVLHQRLHPDAPWLTAGATALLARWLEPHHTGVEWGSGRSTRWLARRVGHLLSIEHHPEWHARISEQLARERITNVDHRLVACEPERIETPEWISAMFASPYVRAVDALDDWSLDFALVDGMYRSACAIAVLPKLRSGALLVVDNVNWFLPSASRAPSSRSVADPPLSPTWQQFAESVAGWELHWTQNGVADTAIWVAP